MVTPCYYPTIGGTENVVKDLAETLTKMRIDVAVMTFNMVKKWKTSYKWKIERIGDVKVFRVPGLNWIPFEHSNKVSMGINLIPGSFTRILREFDIIHFHEDLTFPFFSQTIKKPKIFHLHGWIDECSKEENPIYKFILKRIADVYICLTKKMAENLNKIGVEISRIRVLPNGINTEVFYPASYAEKKDTIIFVGRISQEKGVHILLKSLNFLKNPVHLILIGPSSGNVQYFQQIREIIDKINSNGYHRVEYLHEQERKNLIQWYQKALILVLPSLKEGFPVTCLEALACKTAVVATNVGGIPEVINHMKNGMLVPPNNPFELAEAIQYLLENKEIAAKFAENGRKIVEENFSLEKVAKKLLKIYLEIID
jgi:glycosyltransferase involved in cell wall biosynthesis